MLADNAGAAIGSALILLPLLALVALWAWALVDTLRVPDDDGRPWRVVAHAIEEQAEELIRLESTPARRPLSGHAQRVAAGRKLTWPCGVRLAADTQLSASGRRRRRPCFVPSSCVQRSPSERR
jgi:hypothetical protein